MPTLRTLRRNMIGKNIEIEKVNILEIGAFDYPTYHKEECSIYYMDRFSKEEQSTYHKSALERANRAIDVDFVIKDFDFSKHIDQKFDLVIANHVIEHIPDLISWFREVSSILSKGGHLFLAVPHKEYTFDKLRQLTSISDLIRFHREKHTCPSIYQVFDQFYFHRPIKAEHVWNNDYEHLIERKRFETADSAMKAAAEELASQGYVDVHCGVFTYASFLDLCHELQTSNYIGFQVKDSKDVERPRNEFYVLLEKVHNF